MGEPATVFEIIHASLRSQEPRLTVVELCRIAGVSRSGYYNWVKAEATRLDREEADRKDFELILEAYNFRGYKKGVRSICYSALSERQKPAKIVKFSVTRSLWKKMKNASESMRLFHERVFSLTT